MWWLHLDEKEDVHEGVVAAIVPESWNFFIKAKFRFFLVNLFWNMISFSEREFYE